MGIGGNMSIKFKKLESKEELYQGQTIVATDSGGTQSVETVDCLDNGKVFSECPITKVRSSKGGGEKVEDFFNPEYYSSIYEIVGE
jgi:hypothetical protein